MKIAVLPIFFKDAPRLTTITRTEITAQFDEAKAYYVTISGGREHLEHHVFDWYMVPMTGAEAAPFGFDVGDKIVPLFSAAQGVDFSGFEHFVLLIDKWDARAGAWRPGDPTHRYLHLSAIDLTPALAEHELGHLAGAMHAFLRTPFRDIAYGDGFCIMGGEDVKYSFPDKLGANGPAMTGSTLRACGWLSLGQPGVTVDLGLGNRGEAEVVLAPLTGAPPPGSPGRPVLAWSDGLAPDQRFLIEYRVRSGYDRGLPPSSSGDGWIVAHLTGDNGASPETRLVGFIGANPNALLEMPFASLTLQVTSADARSVALRLTRRIRHLFSGGDGVIYAISDTGDLFWYRHEGRNDGTFRWADANARKIGSGWTFRQVFSGGDGLIYAVNDADDLLWFRHDGRSDGSFKWADASPRKVGAGWNFKHLFSGGDGVIYAIDQADDLWWFRHDGRGDGSFKWADAKGRKVGAGWVVKQVFSSGDESGVIYTTNHANELQWFRHDGRGDGSFRWADAAPRSVGAGWNFKHLFAGGGGVIYAVNEVADLLWFRHDGKDDGSFRWADASPRKVGVGWNFKRKSETTGTVIYGISAAKELVWTLHDGNEDGSFRWRMDTTRVVGAGWDVKQIFSGGDSIIYTINTKGDLNWQRHDGQLNGTFNWTTSPSRPDGTVPPVGIGWNVKHVFSGEDGVIYAINSANELLWYRHLGREDGTFRWTQNGGRKVGNGWDVKHIFHGGDGVIYAINAANDLLWYRHEGREDGSFRWTDGTGRKIGVGWNFKTVFSGRNGVIYAINSANELLWYRHEGREDGSFRWTDAKGRKVGVGWDFQQVIAG